MLVAAVLRPEEGEDGQLEVVRVAAHQLPDAIQLRVGETQSAVERLFGDRAQGASLSAAGDGPGRSPRHRADRPATPPGGTCPGTVPGRVRRGPVLGSARRTAPGARR
jgi:hypothetical protein